ncbi:MAG: hypothetical protein K1X94_27915 [Sandaracinaceae bacterium]|nr:hypothetical protein [Sandaracinaceae bacterium]
MLWSPLRVAAQVDESVDDEAVPTQGRYAWGQGGPSEAASSGPAVHRFARIFGSLGAGGSLRLFYDPDTLHQDLAAPAYLQLRAGYFFEGDGDLQHGVGLGVATNVTPDPTDLAYADGFLELGQWTLAPTYFLRIWVSDDLQVLGSFGVPIGLSGTYQTVGLELAGGVVYKFLAGFGIYAHITFSTYFASFVQPMLSGDAGLVLDYEVLP